MIAAAMESPSSPEPKYIDLARSGATIERIVQVKRCERLMQTVAGAEVGRAMLEFRLFGDKFSGLFSDASENSNQAKTVPDNLPQQIYPAVKGTAQVPCRVECQLCLIPQPREIAIEFNAILANSENQAQLIEEQLEKGLNIEPEDGHTSLQVVVTEGKYLNIEDLIEDELLLNLPGKVCTDLNCPRRPKMAFGEAKASKKSRAPAAEKTEDLAGQVAYDKGANLDKNLQADEDNPFAILRTLKSNAEVKKP